MNAPVRTSRLRRLLVPWGWILLVLLVAAAAWFGWQRFGGGKNPREQYQIATVQRGDLEDLVTATGMVQPRDYVDVGAQVSGQLKKLHVEVGSQVESGDLLAEIDPTVLKATVDARRAGLRNQQATLMERESALALAVLQARRQKNLLAADATTQEAVQEAEAAERAARAQIAAVRAQIEQTQSTLRADEANLNYARIYAPLSGTVVSVTARQGQTLNANQSAPTLMQVADLTTMTVKTQVSEAEVSKLRRGMEVYFTTLGGQGRRWYGTLRKVEPTPTVTNNVVLYNALFDVPNTNNALMPSMTTQVFFIAASAQDVLLVPTAAVTMARPGGGRGARADGAAGGAGGGRGRRDGAASEARSVPGAASSAPVASAPAEAPAPGASLAEPAARGASSPDPRRAAFERMSPEEREAARERRRAARAEGVEPAAAQASGPVQRGSTGGFVGNGGSTRTLPRRGTVKVIDAVGAIEERAVELGVVTRVSAQVLTGLKEGDEVVTGMKPPPGATPASRNPAGGAAGNRQGGIPGGMPPGGGR